MKSSLENLLRYLHILRAQEEYNRNFFENAREPSSTPNQADAIRFILSYIKEHDLGYLLREDAREDGSAPPAPPIPPASRNYNRDIGR